MYNLIFKRMLDLLLSIASFIILLPIIFLLIILISVVFGQSPFFKQERIGKDLKAFVLIKFRSMKDVYDQMQVLLPDEQRLTDFGRFIRRTSLDEIPQLINVIRGDMSFVGPRPLLPEYLPYYDSVQITRHNVRPGITGLAQVNGRNLLTWEDRFKWDVAYVNCVSLSQDLRILFRTVVKVITSEGISAKGHVTMPKFSDQIKVQKQ